jgi:hypothetical protein
MSCLTRSVQNRDQRRLGAEEEDAYRTETREGWEQSKKKRTEQRPEKAGRRARRSVQKRPEKAGSRARRSVQNRDQRRLGAEQENTSYTQNTYFV